MPRPILLASRSEIRKTLLRNAGVTFEAVTPQIDEETVRDAMLAEHSSPGDIADKLAEMKAMKQSAKRPDALVIGCDQVLSFQKSLLAKPGSQDEALIQLKQMRGKRHELLSAVVVCEDGRPTWRFIGTVRLVMRQVSDTYLTGYVARNWDSIRHSVGAYKLEEEG
ncbi:MAG: Maf family protein, partial [Pseudomonadota bacterium]